MDTIIESRKGIRINLFFLLIFLVIPLLLVTRIGEASSLFLNQNSFGQNQSVIAELGSISSVSPCPGGIADFIYPWADVYIIQGHTTPGSGAPLSDVSNGAGTPNTLQYIILDEVLGNTAPAGYLISGNYSVVIDDCQDGKFNGGDWWGEQFTVDIPADIEPMSDTGSAFAAQLAATKSTSDSSGDAWIAAAAAYRALFDSFNAITLFSIATDPLDFILFACTNINLDTGTVYCSFTDAWSGLMTLQNNVINYIINQAFYYKGIAADPPDTNFTEIAVLSGGFTLDQALEDVNQQAALQLGELTSQEAALAEALLHSMERYQGAEQAGNGEYAFVQARQVEDYARALAQIIPRTVAGFQALATQVESSGIDFVTIMDNYRATQARVSSSGLTSEERLKLLSAGWTEQNISDGVADYLNRDFSGLQTADELSTLAAQMAAGEANAIAALNSFADVMAVEQADLAAQLKLPFPDADAGGPYTVDEGVPLALDASASSHPDLANSGLTFNWDLDLDGEFDDASGETTSVTFNAERDGLIGLKVTAPTGYADVAYARVTVNNVNSAPQFTSVNPNTDIVIPFDGAQTFNVSANDVDGDPITYSWDLDGNPVGGGSDIYTYNASLADAGEHIVTIVISDNSVLSPDSRYFWRMTVNAPDNDSDGYPSNVDCDDANSAVNPGATEVYYNGLDDDCNPSTPDDPDLDDDGYDYTVDCDETNAAINPGATEVCNLIDDNCSAGIDEGFDIDNDGVTSCGGDCNDSDANVYPGATEICNLIDDNCNTDIDENFDFDGDGVTSCGGDCNDGDSNNYPGNTEVCDLQDNNCNSSIDEGFDVDSDGYSQCALPVADCNDGNATVYPGAPELCDGLDNNCDALALIDEGVNDDSDGDGQSACQGDCDDSDPLNFSGNAEICDNQDNNCDASIDEGFDLDSDGYSVCSLPIADCDDSNFLNFPGNPEVCDLQDNNCDSLIDEGFDLDGDGFSICSIPEADCDDNAAASYPGNIEICDGLDNNCDGAVDEGFDIDGDGVSICAIPIADCDDADASIYPGRPEVFHNGRNDDCDAGTPDDYAATFIIVPDESGNIYYARSNGDGSWVDYRQVATLSGSIRGAAIADYDNDGDLDFVAGSPSGHTLSFYLFINDGTDNFTNAGVVGIGGNTNSYQMDMTAGDFNHDGNMDFHSNSNWNYLHQGLGDGHGNFTVSTIDLGVGNGRGMDAADFDHDGHLDYVRTDSSARIYLYKGLGDGTFTSLGQVADSGSDAYGLTAADFNNDGHPDIIGNNSSSGDATFFAGNGDGSFASGVYVGSIDFGNHGAFDNYDFNRDGNQDLVASTYTSRKIYYYPGNGDGTFGAAVLINPTDTANYILGISAPPWQPSIGDPVPWITPNPYLGVKGETLTLSGEFSTDDGSIVDYSWDFGDGSSAAGRDIPHTFPNIEDDYRITLQVTDNDGRIGIGTGLVTLVGDPPVANAGGPYLFGEDFAEGGVYTVPLSGSGSTDDGADPLRFNWNLGDDFSEDFSGGAIDPSNWDFSAGATVSAGQAVVNGAGWGNSYLVSRRTFSRNSTENMTFTGFVGSANNNTLMWGLKNTGSDYSYTQFPYAIYFNSNSWIYIYEDGSSRGNLVTYTEGEDYEVRIDLKPGSGAIYYFRAVGSPGWKEIYNSSHSSASSFRLGATVNGGAIRLDDFTRDHVSMSETPTATYDRQDTFNISLRVTDIAEQSDTDLTTLETVVGDPPVSDPAGPYTPGEANASCGNYNVFFDGSGSSDDSGRIFRYDWDFGDGASASGVAPSHIYAAGGPIPNNYVATLTVTDHVLQQNIITSTANVSPSPGAFPLAITGDYSVDETAANSGLWTVNFNGNSSTDDFALCDFSWNFGDGGSGSGATPSHQYAAAGDYSATLTVRDNALQSHQVGFSVHVAANDPPVPEDGGPYAVDEAVANNGLWTVNFDAGASTDDIGIWKYSWGFGDGSSGSGVNPSHNYAGTGTYNVTLTVFDHAGQTTTSTTQVTVNGNNPPVADAGSTHITERGLAVTLDASASTDDFGILSYSWDFDIDEQWAHSGVSITDDVAQLTGIGGWDDRYLVSLDTFPRVAGESYTGRVDTDTSTNVMWGLKNDSNNYSYTQFPYAIYFNNNNWIYIYEDGNNRGNKVTYSRGQTYDIRIDVKASGATYYYRLADAGADWTLIYDSSHSSISPVRLGATVHTGAIGLSEFVTPTGEIPLLIEPISNHSVTDITYLVVGVYNPAVTVTDHALQTDTDSTTVTVIEGNAPVADAGGPYLTNEDIPTRFNGRGSSDDFGIKTYTWDFGDGETLVTRNPFADHRYLAAGSYTLTLTVHDYAGHASSDSATVNVSADPVVAAVPWRFSGGIEIPHDTWSGHQARLKAVAWSLHEPLTYEWNFGDGSAPETGTVANKRVIEARHTYSGVEGKPFTATITVTDANGRSVSDQYHLRIGVKSLDVETNVAIDNGLWYLHGIQSRSESSGLLYGEWSFGGYSASSTASATQAFEINGHLELGDVREDPYVETASRGLHSLFSKLRAADISNQTYGNPDSNNNGIGIEVNSNRPIYEGGMVMDAIAGSGSAGIYADSGPAGVINRTYKDIAQDMVDQYAWGQYDSASVGGGWRYSWNQHPDNSAAQWGAIGVLALKQVFGLDLPQWAKDSNNVWLNYSFGGAGFGYTGAGTGQALTPSGMVQMPMNELETSDSRWIASEANVTQNWNSWYRNNCNYYALFALSKALRLALPNPVVNLTGPGTYNGLDWFNDPVSGLARTLIDDNFATSNGSFGGVCGHATGDLASAWGVIMLTPTLFVQPPVADAGSDRVWGVDVPIIFDASGSFHQDPLRSIVKYEWDVDGDGIYDSESTSPTLAHTYSAADYPEASLPQAITVRLRVTDNNDPAQKDTDTVNIIVAVPPHPPVADIGGPYNCTAGVSCTLDGSGSFDIDPTDFITAWEWDLNNDGQYDDANGVNPVVVFPNVGQVNIGLRVVDNAVLNDANGNGVQDPDERLDDFDFIAVTVNVNNPPVADPGGPYSVDEGFSVALDGSGSTDPDGNPIVSYSWDLDNDGQFDDATGVSATFDASSLDDGIYTVGLRVSDSVLTDSITTTVTVNNRAPVVDSGVDQSVNDGDSVNFNGSFTDPGTLDTHSIEWSFGDGSPSVGGTLTPTHLYSGIGFYTVTLTVTDDDGGVGTDSLLVTVNNVAPVVNAGADQLINEGDSTSFSGSFTDTGVTDTHTIEWNFGDGSPPATGTLTPDHVYVDNGVYSVTLTVTDNNGAAGSDSLLVTVNNLAPVVDAGADQTVNEGDLVNFSGSFTDPGVVDTHTVEWDFGDGSAPQSGTLTPSHVYANNGSYTVTLTVTDDDGGVGSDSLQVTVQDSGAAVVNAGPDQTINEGDTVNFNGSHTDPGLPSTHSYEWNFGDGSPPVNGTLTPSHTYLDDGLYTVTLVVTSDDGVGTDSLLVTVHNVAPEVDAGPDQVINEGGLASFAGSFTDQGIVDTHSIEWNFGDGSPLVIGTLTPTHVFLDNGFYTVTLTVTDDDGGVGSDSLLMIVNNVAPVVDAGADQTVNEGDTVSFAGSFTDPGIVDTHTIAWDFGDGSPPVNGTLTPNHTYANNGVYSVTLTVTDDDGGEGMDSLQVTVLDSAVQPEPPISGLYARAKSGKVDLVWAPVATASGYNVYRSTTQGGPYSAVATNHQCDYCAYADFGLIDGTTYYYVVTWLSGGAESAYSNEASATPQARIRRR